MMCPQANSSAVAKQLKRTSKPVRNIFNECNIVTAKVRLRERMIQKRDSGILKWYGECKVSPFL
jgi:hypothetical protein